LLAGVEQAEARWQPTAAKLSLLIAIKGMLDLSLKAGVVHCIESLVRELL
jgi:hypothetical protein